MESKAYLSAAARAARPADHFLPRARPAPALAAMASHCYAGRFVTWPNFFEFEGARFGGSELRCGSGLHGVRRWSGAGQTKGLAGLFLGNLFQLTHYSFDAPRD